MLSQADRSAIKSGLESGKLFGAAGLDEVGHLLDACTIETYESGQHLLEPGVSNRHLYVVLEGELLVYPDGAGLPDSVALGLGDCVGEISLLEGHVASALVIPSCQTRLLAIPHNIVWDMIERSHAIARNLLGILAGRMRNDNLALVSSDDSSLEFVVSASVDTLTGLHNRRWMQDAFPRAMQRCEHDAAPLCLMLVDVDDFARFNALYDHRTGDNVLRMVARKLVEGLRSQDLLVRYGGEEFALLLPEANLDQGFQIAERLRQSVASHALSVGSVGASETVTITCGIAAMQVDDNFDALLSAADAALKLARSNRQH